MKSFKFFTYLCIGVFTLLAHSSCLNNAYNKIEQKNYLDFDFKTTQSVDFTLTTLDPTNKPMQGIKTSIYSEKPYDESGLLKSDYENFRLFLGSSNAEGKMICSLTPEKTVDSLYILIEQVGFPVLTSVKKSSTIDITIGGSEQASSSVMQKTQTAIIPEAKKIWGYWALGTWKKLGVPNYFITRDNIDASLLADINYTFTEKVDFTKRRPDLFENPSDQSLLMQEDGELFMTFVHDGTISTSVLFYYTYDSNNPPKTFSDIKDLVLAFPNVSFVGSGGGLVSGDKVQLFYLNTTTNTYSNIFPKGKNIGWGLLEMGWRGTYPSSPNLAYFYFTNQALNPDVGATFKKHDVVFYDFERKHLLVGFEDWRRERGADNDFNDVIFYATANPSTAIFPQGYAPSVKVQDADGDGISDINDEFPNDPTKVFNNYYPSKNGFGTLVYEDLWPTKGDYDFNDLVIDYNFQYATNAYNEVVSVDATIKVKAVGASRQSGFGIQFNTTPENIESLSGPRYTNNKLNLLSNGVEGNQSKAVVIVFDEALKTMKHPGGGVAGINTTKGISYVTPAIFNIKFNLKKPVPIKTFGIAPYNPFLFSSDTRGKEIHLPGMPPSDLVDTKLFGTNDDDSSIEKSRYYVSAKYLPWALNLTEQFNYPIEKENIAKSYLKFMEWADSKGEVYNDWYMNKPGYRDNNTIFEIP